MDDSKTLNDFPLLLDDEAFEAVRHRMNSPARQTAVRDVHDVRELEGRRREWYPESSLERHHPHVVEKLVLLWGYPECGVFLDSLVIDWRGNRNGFKREVMEELLFLHTLSPHIATGLSPWREAGRHMP